MKKRIPSILFIISAVVILSLSVVPTAVGIASSRSGMSVLIGCGIDIFMSGDSYVSPAKTDKKIEKRRKKNAEYSVPSSYLTLFSARVSDSNGYEVCYFGDETEEKIVYFHGGSFMWQPLISHFSFCRLLSERTGLQVIMPVYPKAPENDSMDIIAWLDGFYSSVNGAVAFVGDSAGATILLSFSQYLHDNGRLAPDKLILLSPLFDVCLSNPEIESYAKKDPMLNRDDLKRKVDTYVADGDPTDPYVNPIYCDYSSLGRVTVIAGTNDILFPDAKLWHEEMTAKSISHDFIVFENQPHVFALYPMPERSTCLEIISKALGVNGVSVQRKADF